MSLNFPFVFFASLKHVQKLHKTGKSYLKRMIDICTLFKLDHVDEIEPMKKKNVWSTILIWFWLDVKTDN